jgi:hypothetical protein
MKAVNKLNRVVFPNKLSELIALSIKCLFKCSSDPKYNILPGTTHYQKDGICYVDMTGAVLAKHVGIDPKQNVNLANCPRKADIVISLDDVAQGDIKAALDFGDFAYTKEQLEKAKKAWSNKMVPVVDNAEWLNEWKDYCRYLKSINL